jgi:hypothetical protein
MVGSEPWIFGVPMKIHLVRSSDVSRGLLANVYDLLVQEDGPAQFLKDERAVSFHGQEPELSWEMIFEKCTEYRARSAIPSEDFIILLISRRNSQNWFASADPKGTRSIFIHTAEWDTYLTDCEPCHPIAFECWANLLHSFMYDSFEEALNAVHDPSIGCVSDLCLWKPDISYKLRTADVCEDCLTRLQERGISHALISQALDTFEALRKHMLFSRGFRGVETHESKLPFPVAYTRRKLSMTMEPLRKFLLLIDHFDSLVRTTVILLGSAVLRGRLPDFLREKELDGRPSLGNWVNALHSLTEHSAEFGLVSLPNDLSARIHAVVGGAEQANIVRMRNEQRGHGYIECRDSGYQKEFNACSPVVTDIENVLTPVLTRLNCYQVISAERKSATEFEVTVRSMMGSHPDFVVSCISYTPDRIENIPYNGLCYLYTRNDGEWVTLHPYMQFKECPLCHHSRVLLSDGQQYLDSYEGHRVNLD